MSDYKLFQIGAQVRVIDAVPGWGGALDRYGTVVQFSLAALKLLVQTQKKTGWVRMEDLVHAR